MPNRTYSHLGENLQRRNLFSMKNVRAIAAQIITNLTRQRGSLSTQLTDFSNHPEISLLQEIVLELADGICHSNFFSTN